jgi:phosphotriesterase-related protein
MATVQTMRGAVDSAQLGVTLMHEHIFITSPDILMNYPEFWGDDDQHIEDAVLRLNELYDSGVHSVVDLTVVGLGRYIPRIQKVAQRTKLNIIVATGLYTYNDIPFFFHYRGPGTLGGGPEVMADMFVKDIEQGIAGTGVKAGILKCATDVLGLTEGVERSLRATAQAHLRTGVSISTHTHARSHRGLDQQKVFREEGVDLSRIVIGHCGDTTEIPYLEELIDNGSYIGMDRFGIDTILPFEARVDTVVEMCKRGHAGKMVLSQDASCFSDWLEPGLIAAILPKWDYMHIYRDVIPALKERGVTDVQVHQMMVENPKKFFDNVGKY